MAAAKFLLEHFYYGQIVHDGKATGEPRLLAASPGVSDELVELAIERASLPPLIRSSVGAWALVRGRDRRLPFVLVQSQQGQAGQLMSHYIVAAPDMLRAVAGNLSALNALVQDTLPTYDKIGDALDMLELAQPQPLTVEKQVDDVLDLMTYTQNKTDVIEGLLAGIVQGVQVIVQGAPDDIKDRIGFVEGLLALLPPSARFGVTFTTHSLPTTDIDTQIRFYSDDIPPKNTVVYNWAQARLSGESFDDEYSHFMVSQLRLDAELAIRRTRALTQIAGWKLNQGERLADSLGYASSRVKVDEALRNNQPVNKDEVSRILAEDPTLNADLRALYARHLITFSLAMRDMSHADSVVPHLQDNPQVEATTRELLNGALDDGQAALIYDSLTRWIADENGPDGPGWVDLTHKAALSLLEELVAEKDIDGMNDFVEKMLSASAAVPFGGVFDRVSRLLLPFCGEDQHLAENLFLLAVKFLNTDDFRRIMNDSAFRQQLSPNINKAWEYLSTGTMYSAASESLVRTVTAFGPPWEWIVLLRFAEMAAMSRKFGLLETPTLAVLADLAQSDHAGEYRDRLLWIAGTMDDTVLATLEGDGALHLLQIRLALGDYHGTGQQMLNHAKKLYPGDLLHDYIRMVYRLFSETTFPTEDIPNAMEALEGAGIRSAPLIMAQIGALAKQNGETDLDAVAVRAADGLFEEARLVQVIPPESLVRLLTYHARRRDVKNTIRVASLIPVAASYQGERSLAVMAAMYKRMTWDDQTKLAALQMLRTYVREAENDNARKAVAYFGREAGDEVRAALQTTYTLKRFTGDTDLVAYAARIRRATALLLDMTSAYHAEERESPTQGAIYTGLDGLGGSITRDERRELADRLMVLGRALVFAGKQYRDNRQRDEAKYQNRVLTLETDPRSVLDIFRAMGGYFARGKGFPVVYTPRSVKNPFAVFDSVNLLRDAVNDAAQLLEDGLHVYPPSKPARIPAAMLRGEMESMWGDVPPDEQQRLVAALANDLQYLADIIALIEADGDFRVLEDNSQIAKRIDGGKHRPRSVLEMLRYASNVFKSR